MKKAKQLLSSLLVLLMVFSLAPQVFAGSASREEAAAQWEQRQWEMNYEEWQQAGGHYHQYTGYTVLKEPTCSEYGEAYMYCAICGESKTELIAKLPHTWGEWEILVEVTDHSAGLRVHTCQVCGTVEQEEFDPEGTLRPGDHGDAVEHLQHLLVDQDYLDRHLITRDYDWQTEQAVKKAQGAFGLNVDGIGWPQTQDCLEHDFGVWVTTKLMTCSELGERERTCIKCGYVEKETVGTILRPGDWRNNKDQVTALQEKLIELGYLTGTADGDYGGKTADAVKRFQRDNEFAVDGTIWPCQWDFLFPTGEDIIGQIGEPNDEEEPDDEDKGDIASVAKAVLPDAAGKGGVILDAELVYKFKKDPEPDGSYKYNSKSDVEYDLILTNHTGYTLKNIEIYFLSEFEWKKLNTHNSGVPAGNYDKAHVLTREKMGPYESTIWGPYKLINNAEAVNSGNGTYRLRAFAFCDFYDGDEFLGSTKPDAEATVKIGDEESYNLSAELTYEMRTEPANGQFYTEGEAVKYMIWLKNTSKYDIKGIKGYRVDKYNVQSINNTGGIYYSYGELLSPGKSIGFGPIDGTIVFREDGSFHLKYSGKNTGYDNSSLQSGGFELFSFVQCNFKKDGKLLGSDTFTASEFVPVGTENPSAELEIKETSKPKNGNYYVEGEKITADFILSNTGNLIMSFGSVYYDLPDKPENFGDGTINLTPGVSETVYHYTATVNKDDVEEGSVMIGGHAYCTFNSVKAGGFHLPPIETTPLVLPTGYKPEVSLTVEEHTAPANGVCYVEGEVIDYYFYLHNTGKVDLDYAELKGGIDGESKLIGTQSNLPAKTDSAPFSFQHKVTHEEAEKGSVTFSVETTAQFKPNYEIPLNAFITSQTGNPAITVNIAVAKEPDNGEFYIRNETVDYVITVSNTGNVAIPKVEVYDITPTGGTLLATFTDYAPGESTPLPSSYTVQASDVAAGVIEVTGNGYGIFAGESEHKSSDSFTRKTGMYEPNVTIVKEVISEPENHLYYRDNEDIKYSITVTNNGKEALPAIMVIDHDPGTGFESVLDNTTEFQPGASLNASYVYNVGILTTAVEIENTAEAKYMLPDGTTDSVKDTVTSLAGRDPEPELAIGGGVIPSVQKGDACEVTVTETDDSISYTVKHCEQHKKAADTVDEQFAKVADPLTAWQYAGKMWKAQVTGMYIEMTNGAKDEQAKAVVEAEKEAFFAWLDAFEAKLNTKADDPAEAAKTVALLLRDHCAELCHISRTAPTVKEETKKDEEPWVSPEEPETEETEAFGKWLKAKEDLLKAYYPSKAEFVQKELVNTEKRRLNDLPPVAVGAETPAASEAAASDDPFTGTWYVDLIDMGGGTLVHASEMGLTMTLVFSEDGTAVLNGMGQAITGTWKVDGDSAVFTAQGMDAIFTPTETGLRGVQDGAEMTFTREASGTGFVPAEPVAAGSISDFDGRWKAATIAMEGITMSYEAANANSSLPILPSDTVIISDGAVAYEGQDPEAFIFKDGALVEQEEGNWEPDTYRLLADGTMVYVFMGYMNVYFERDAAPAAEVPAPASDAVFVPAEPIAAESRPEFDGTWEARYLSMDELIMPIDEVMAEEDFAEVLGIRSTRLKVLNGQAAFEGETLESYAFVDGTFERKGEYDWQTRRIWLLADGMLAFEISPDVILYYVRAE